MKKIFPAIIQSLLFSLLFISCGKCICDPAGDDSLQFKLVNSNKNDLYSGATAIYKIDSLKIFYKNISGTLQQENTSISKCTCSDSSIFVSFYTSDKKSTYYFYYNANTFDSVNIEWKRIQAKCCGEPYSYNAIQSVKFKNTTVIPDSKGIYYFIK